MYPYDEARFSPLLGAVPAGSGMATVVVPMTTSLPDETGLTFSANLVNAETGAALRSLFNWQKGRGRGTRLSAILEFPLDQVPDGKYLLYSTPETKPRARSPTRGRLSACGPVHNSLFQAPAEAVCQA